MSAVPSRRLAFDRYTIDTVEGRLFDGAAEVPLRPKAFEVLRHLIENAPDLVPKERLIDAVWPSVVVGDDSLVQCVREIRIALHDEDQKIIRTVPRRGYIFTRPVHVGGDPPRNEPQAERGHAPRAASHQWRRWWAGAAALALAVAAITGAAFRLAAAPGARTTLTIAVLPLRNLGTDQEQEYFAEALADNLITDLSRLPHVMVIARRSSVAYRDAQEDTRRIGAELGVRYLVQGSVSRLGSDVHLNLRMVEASSGRQLWAERFEAPRGQLIELQRRMNSELSRTLQVRMVGDMVRTHAKTADVDDLTLHGWYLWQQTRPDTVAQARELLLQAIRLDPNAAEAWAVLTFTYISDLSNNWIQLRPGHTWDEWLAHAQQAADKAWRLDPTLLHSKGARAAVLMFTGRTHEAIALSEQQIAMNPSELIARHDLAALLLFNGQPERVGVVEQEAMRISPLDPLRYQMTGIIALAELHLGHDRQALQWAERAVALNPDYGSGQAYVAAAAALLGDMPKASAALAQLRRVLPEHRIVNFRDEFDRYSAQPDYRAGMDRFYEGIRRAGLLE